MIRVSDGLWRNLFIIYPQKIFMNLLNILYLGGSGNSEKNVIYILCDLKNYVIGDQQVQFF